ncbi:M43 family zinc metalloprotease [Nibrella viscosa]
MVQRLLFFLLVFTFSSGLRAQTHTHNHTDEQCATMQMDSLLRARYPQLGPLNDFEQALQRKIKEIQERQRSGRVLAEVITIPVVVHVVHNGEAVGTGRNISDAQVRAQIETLNEDFRRKPGTRGFNDNPVGADIEIEFCMAAVGPQGQTLAERGIDRVRGAQASWTRDQIEGQLKPSTFWDPDKYFNIWVVDFAASDSRLLGYAQFPSQSSLPGIPNSGGPASTDGVVVRYQSFGNAEKGNFPVMQAPYNLGRTLTHEVGHWLGLRHIWGDANCGDDFVGDTPPQASESRGCPVGRVSCGAVNMVQNYMDYSDDACFNIFTIGQKQRMRAVMEISPRRATLLTSNVCGSLVASRPIPNFRADTRRVLLGGTVRFNDLSGNFPTAWEWTFEGGTPSTSNERNPIVTYNQPGRYRVRLVVRNSAGQSDPLVREEYIEVLNIGLCGEVSNFNGTPTVLRHPVPTVTGYASGQNSRRIRAVSEFFENPFGYTNLSGASLRFGVAKAATGAATESTVLVTVWNARGFQNGPGAILEQKEVPLRTILDDVANNRPTSVTFDRNVPLSPTVTGLGFHVGVELKYAQGDTVALVTTRNGESLFATSWFQSQNGDWARFTDSLGLNIAHNISARVGMKPSVQISASSLFVNPGEAVTLSARGAGVFNWGPATTLSSTLGPQVIARPTVTTSYTVTGTGTDLCESTATARVFVRAGQVTSVPPPQAEQALTLTPNPSHGEVTLSLRNALRGPLTLTVRTLTGVDLIRENHQKTADAFDRKLDLRTLPGGMYLLDVQVGGQVFRQRMVKN